MYRGCFFGLIPSFKHTVSLAKKKLEPDIFHSLSTSSAMGDTMKLDRSSSLARSSGLIASNGTRHLTLTARWIKIGGCGNGSQQVLGGCFKHFLFSALPGEMIQFDQHIFQMG